MPVSLKDLGIRADELEGICQRWGIARLFVFGSFARGEDRPESDIDLMVAFSPGRKPSLWRFVELKDEFEALLGRSVDLVIEGSVENPYRRRNIERDLTQIYAA